jgi:hypothetical protein
VQRKSGANFAENQKADGMSTESRGDSTAEEINRIRSRIEGLLTECFDRGEPVYYLSRLGAQLGADRVTLEKLTGAKLATFLRDTFDYEIGSEGQHNNILFVKSKTAAANTAFPPTPAPRYQPRFWKAFAAPLPDGEHRYINLETLKFDSSRDALGADSADVHEIEARFIAPAGASGNASETIDRIGAWLKEQGLDSAPFLMTRKKTRRDGQSLLDAVLTALDGDQLKRVSLPMDIVKTLNDHPL